MGSVTRIVGPLTKGSSSVSVSLSPWPLVGRIGVPSPLLGNGVNSTSTHFSAVSWVRWDGLVAFQVGLGVGFLVGHPVLHSATWYPSRSHLKQAVECRCDFWGFASSLFPEGDFFHPRPGWHLLHTWSISPSLVKMYQPWRVREASLEMQML